MYTYTHTITFTYTQPSPISMSLVLQDKQLNSKPYNNRQKIIKSNHIVHLLNNFVLLNWLIFGLCLISWLRLSINDVIQGLWVFLPLVFISLSRSLASSIRSSHCVLRMRGISMSQTRKRHLMGAEEVCSAASSLSAASSPRCGVQWSMFSLRFGWGVFWDDSNLEVFSREWEKSLWLLLSSAELMVILQSTLISESSEHQTLTLLHICICVAALEFGPQHSSSANLIFFIFF